MNFRIIILYIAIFLSAISADAQNTPANNSLPTGIGAGTMAYPKSFNAGSIPQPNRYNYVRVYSPLVPLTSIPAFNNTKTQGILVNTTYYSGWNNPLMDIKRTNNSNRDIVTPYDYRISDTILSFLSYPDTFHSKFSSAAYTEQKNYYLAKYPLEGENAYSKSISNNVGAKPTSLTYEPGKALVGYQRGLESIMGFNKTGDVFKLTYVSPNVCKTGTYTANELVMSKTTGQHNQIQLTYTDKKNLLICEKTYIGGTAGNSGWLCTYYIYDDLNRLVCKVPPVASVELGTSTCMAVANSQCIINEYNKEGDVIKMNIPGHKYDGDMFVYNSSHQIALSQTAKQRDSSKWSFTIYDKLNRPVIIGITQRVKQQFYWEGIMNGTTTPDTGLVRYNQTLEYWLVHGCSGEDYPDSIVNCTIVNYNYYDTYEFEPANMYSFNGSFSSYYISGTGIETPQPYLWAQGKLVASKSRILKEKIANNFTSDWMTSVYYYDEKGRVIQTQTSNQWNLVDVRTAQYDFTGKPVVVIDKINGRPGSNKMVTNIQTRYAYNPLSGLLISVNQKIDTGIWMPLSVYLYNELGQVIQKTVGNVDVQDFQYNIRGQLIGINADSLRRFANSDRMSYFSSIHYETGFDTARYDGRISGYKWRSSTIPLRGYGYLYDPSGRLLSADYRDSTVMPSWVKTIRDFSVSNITYDDNGNIKTMRQRGYNTAMQPANIDVLNYTYNTSNQLTRVTDSTVVSPISDFENPNGTNTDYTYDQNGNLFSDANKGITAIYYNQDEKPYEIKFGTNGTIRNVYSATGDLLQKTVVGNGDSVVYQYCGPLVFRRDSLQYSMHNEGRARWLGSTGGFRYDFFIKDHLGNVRIVKEDSAWQVTPPPLIYGAGWELLSASTEEAMFDNIGQVRDGNPTGTPDDAMSARLNGSDATRRVAASLLLHGMTGDKFDVQVLGYYQDTSTENMNTYAPPSDMLSAITTSLTSNVTAVGEGGATIVQTINDLLTSANYGIYESLRNTATDPAYPRAYLNVLVFDEEFTLQAAKSQVIQLRGSSSTWNSLVANQVILASNGYLISYLSNGSNLNAHYDQLTTQHFKGNLKEEQHYYPFGLSIDAGVATPSLKNKYLYQSKELISDLNLELYDFHARMYDAQIGRFWGIDPMYQYASGYIGMGNDPANLIDPSGMRAKAGSNGGIGVDRSQPASYLESGMSGDFLIGQLAAVGGIPVTAFTAPFGGAFMMSNAAMYATFTGSYGKLLGRTTPFTVMGMDFSRNKSGEYGFWVDNHRNGTAYSGPIIGTHFVPIKNIGNAVVSALNFMDGKVKGDSRMPRQNGGYVMSSDEPAPGREPEYGAKANNVYGMLNIDVILAAMGVTRPGPGFGEYSHLLEGMEGVEKFFDAAHFSVDYHFTPNHGKSDTTWLQSGMTVFKHDQYGNISGRYDTFYNNGH
jgi:RHS repeat-associated protein